MESLTKYSDEQLLTEINERHLLQLILEETDTKSLLSHIDDNDAMLEISNRNLTNTLLEEIEADVLFENLDDSDIVDEIESRKLENEIIEKAEDSMLIEELYYRDAIYVKSELIGIEKDQLYRLLCDMVGVSYHTKVYDILTKLKDKL